MNRWTRAVTRGITAGVLWTLCGRGKNLQFGAVGVLCRRSGGSRTALPLETGTARGRLRGRGKGRETGACRGCLAPAADPAVWRPGYRFAGAVGPGEAPPSHTWRGLVVRGTFCRSREQPALATRRQRSPAELESARVAEGGSGRCRVTGGRPRHCHPRRPSRESQGSEPALDRGPSGLYGG